MLVPYRLKRGVDFIACCSVATDVQWAVIEHVS